MLLAVTVLNVYKPAGLTAYGWRKQRDERRALGGSVPERVASATGTHIQPGGTVPTASSLSRLTTRAIYFVFHLAEMWFAMFVGMAAFAVVKVRVVWPGAARARRPGVARVPDRHGSGHGDSNGCLDACSELRLERTWRNDRCNAAPDRSAGCLKCIGFARCPDLA